MDRSPCSDCVAPVSTKSMWRPARQGGTLASYRVIVSDQVFPSVELERELLAEIGADLEVAPGTVDDLRSRAADADAVLNTYLPIDANTIAAMPRCRIIARYGIGVDNVDVAAAAAAGMTVTNVPDYSIAEVAAHALALILALIRKLPQANAKVRGGGWGLEGLRPIRRVSELTFGLVGFGKIARQFARSLEMLGGTIVVHDPYVRAAPGIPPLLSLDDLLSKSDVVSIHAPLTPETRGLIDARALARMPAGGISSTPPVARSLCSTTCWRHSATGTCLARAWTYSTKSPSRSLVSARSRTSSSPRTWPTTPRTRSPNPSARQQPR